MLRSIFRCVLFNSPFLSALRGRDQYGPVDNFECRSKIMQNLGIVWKQTTQRSSVRNQSVNSSFLWIIVSSTKFRDALMLRYTRHLWIYHFLTTVGASTRSLMWFTPLIVNRVLCALARAWYRDVLRYRAHVSSPSRIWCEPMINPTPMRVNGNNSPPSDFLDADRGDLLTTVFWGNRLIPLLMFAWRILAEKLKGTCNPRRLNMTYPSLQAILKASW